MYARTHAVSIAVCVPVWVTTSIPLGGVFALMSLSLVAASLLGWNDAWDVHVQQWNHIHLFGRLIKTHRNVTLTSEKDFLTGPFLKCSQRIWNDTLWEADTYLQISLSLSRDGFCQTWLSRKFSAKWFWVVLFFFSNNKWHTCPFDTEDYGCWFLPLFGLYISTQSFCLCQ